MALRCDTSTSGARASRTPSASRVEVGTWRTVLTIALVVTRCALEGLATLVRGWKG
jgi:hypothetical protein